jgi:hypothetical protein
MPLGSLVRSTSPQYHLAHAHKMREHASQGAQSGWKAAAGVRTEPKLRARCVNRAPKALPELEKDLEL